MLGAKLLEEVQSPLNGLIQVKSIFGQPRILVNGMIQSGGLTEAIWKKGVKKISNLQPVRRQGGLLISNVLILGLGGGTAVQLINKYFPQAKITGVEIDPIMIKLGKKYFALDKITNLKIINTNALDFAKNYALHPTPYTLILVDLYLGNQFPVKAESKPFLMGLKKLVVQDGVIVINRLFEKKDKNQVKRFIKKLDNYFARIELIRAWSNLLVVCSR